MMPALFLEPRLHSSVIKFFAVIRLHAERPRRRGLAANSFQSSYHVLAAFRFDSDGPGILGQDIDHGQQIFVPLISSTEFLHVHQIHLPLFVSVKDERGSGGKPRPSGFVELITQHRLENPLRLRGFQFLGFGKGIDPTQGPRFLGIFVSAWQRHDNTDTTSFPFSFFNSFFSHTYMISFVSKQGHATKVFMQMPLPLPLPLPLLGCRRFRKLIHPLLMTLLWQGLG